MKYLTYVKACWVSLLVLPIKGSARSHYSFDEFTAHAVEPILFFIVVLQKICWLLGGAFVIGAFVQYLQYRQNPSQVPISRPVLLGLLGLLLAFLPTLTSSAI